jgi:hypothetical protein
MKVKEQIDRWKGDFPDEIPTRLHSCDQVNFINHFESRVAAKENSPPIHRWEHPSFDPESRQGRQNTKLPNKPICHFAKPPSINQLHIPCILSSSKTNPFPQRCPAAKRAKFH